MADLDLDSIPDRGHRQLAEVILQAVADGQANLGDIQSSFSLTDLLFDFIGQLLDDNSALNIRCDALQIDRDTAMTSIDDLQARVTALEQPSPPEA